MKKVRLILLVFIVLSLTGCGKNSNWASKESAICNLVPVFAWKQHMIMNAVKLDANPECNDRSGSANQEGADMRLMHSSEWYPYEWVEDVPSYGYGADHSFMTNDQDFSRAWYFELNDILYDYEQRTNGNLKLMSESWRIDKIISIGSDYYNVCLHQEGTGVSVDLLLNPTQGQYKVLYAVCDKGEHIIYDDLRYMSQYDWKAYIWEETSAIVNNPLDPFDIVYATSLNTVIAASVTAYESETGYEGHWEIQDIYTYSGLINCKLISEDRVAWFCVGNSQREYAAEIFYMENL